MGIEDLKGKLECGMLKIWKNGNHFWNTVLFKTYVSVTITKAFEFMPWGVIWYFRNLRTKHPEKCHLKYSFNTMYVRQSFFSKCGQ